MALVALWSAKKLERGWHWRRPSRGILAWRGEAGCTDITFEDMQSALMRMWLQWISHVSLVFAAQPLVSPSPGNRYVGEQYVSSAILGTLLPLTVAWARGDEAVFCRAVSLLDRYVRTPDWPSAVLPQEITPSTSMPTPTPDAGDGVAPPPSPVIEAAVAALYFAAGIEEIDPLVPRIRDMVEAEYDMVPSDTGYGPAAAWVNQEGEAAGRLGFVLPKDIARRSEHMARALDYKLEEPTVYDMFLVCDCAAWSLANERVRMRWTDREGKSLRTVAAQLTLLACTDSLMRTVPDPWTSAAALSLLIARMAFPNDDALVADIVLHRLSPLLSLPSARIVARANDLLASVRAFIQRPLYARHVRGLLVRDTEDGPTARLVPSRCEPELGIMEGFVNSAPLMLVTESMKRKRTP